MGRPLRSQGEPLAIGDVAVGVKGGRRVENRPGRLILPPFQRSEAGMPGRVQSSGGQDSPHLTLREWWRRSGQPRVPAPDPHAAVAQLVDRHGLILPQDFESYLLEAAAGEALWDDGDIKNWWPLHQIESLPEGYEYTIDNTEIAHEAEKYLLYADYLIWCRGWAVCCSNGPNRGKVALIGGAPDRFVADSISEFIARYLHDADSMANQV
jgi:hypothetical protein